MGVKLSDYIFKENVFIFRTILGERFVYLGIWCTERDSHLIICLNISVIHNLCNWKLFHIDPSWELISDVWLESSSEIFSQMIKDVLLQSLAAAIEKYPREFESFSEKNPDLVLNGFSLGIMLDILLSVKWAQELVWRFYSLVAQIRKVVWYQIGGQ